MEQKPKYKRRIVFIKRSLQLKYIVIVVLAMILVAFTVGWDVYYTVGRAIIELNHPELFPLMVKVNNLMLGKLVLLVFIVIIIAVFVSHKFAGPIFRFEKSCDVVSSGDLTHRVILRSGDELTELQDKFNNMIFVFQKSVSDSRNTAKIIEEKITAISLRLSQKNISPFELSEISKQLDEVITDLNKISSGFKI